MEPMKPKPGKTINKEADKLDELNAAIDKMMAQRTQLLNEIRTSAHDAVVVFVDMVGSSQSKRDHEHEPEVWIYKVRRFYEVVSGYVQQLGGRVIKYIGDEVMAVFDGDTRDNDSANFITRVAEIETSLRKATGEPTSLKVAVDRGQVYTIDLPGHDEPDVLGTAIDRCARIGKFTKPGVVLASYEYRKGCGAAYKWTQVGEPELKGVGKTKIFQLGEKTIDIIETTEVAVSELERLKRETAEQKDQIEKLTIQAQEVKGMNVRLQEQLRVAGEKIVAEDQAENDDDEELTTKEEFEQHVRQLKITARGLPSVAMEAMYYRQRGEDWYPRTGFGTEDQWEDINRAAERGFVQLSQDDTKVSLNENHPKVRKALAKLSELEAFMQGESVGEDFLSEFEDEEGYPFDLSNRDFWREHLDL